MEGQMIEQAAQATGGISPQVIWGFLASFIFMVVGQLFLIIREVIKQKDFKSKNGTLDDIKKGINKVFNEITGIKSNCNAVSSALTKQTDDNSKQILDLWKTQGKKDDG